MVRPQIGRGLWVVTTPPRCRHYATTPSDAANALQYCLGQLQKGDREASLIYRFLPPAAQPTYAALRTLNLELVRLPETVSTPELAQLRLRVLRDSLEAAFAGRPPREPVCVLLDAAARNLASRDDGGGGGGAASLKWWTMRLLRTRTAHTDGRPLASLSALEDRAEGTYSALMYATLAALPVRSAHADHLASHVGKAAGIVAALRGIAVLSAAAPSRAPGTATLPLPLDVMAEAGLREEDFFRLGPAAPGLRDAVFRVATQAHDHLLTAREMLRSLRAGQGAGHECCEGHASQDHLGLFADRSADGDDDDGATAAAAAATDVRRAFGVFLDAVPAREYLRALERRNFDPFMRWGWGNVLLPWRLWQAAKREEF